MRIYRSGIRQNAILAGNSANSTTAGNNSFVARLINDQRAAHTWQSRQVSIVELGIESDLHVDRINF
jgi:hypothetical protein